MLKTPENKIKNIQDKESDKMSNLTYKNLLYKRNKAEFNKKRRLEKMPMYNTYNNSHNKTARHINFDIESLIDNYVNNYVNYYENNIDINIQNNDNPNNINIDNDDLVEFYSIINDV